MRVRVRAAVIVVLCLFAPTLERAWAGQSDSTHPCYEFLGDPYPGAGPDQLICGDEVRNHINGDVGDDRIYGRAGNDWLIGGRGRDAIYGGPGTDTCYIQPIDRRVIGCERIRKLGVDR